MRSLFLGLALVSAVATSAMAGDNAWLDSHFSNVPTVTNNTGAYDTTDNSWRFTGPVYFKNMKCEGGYYCIRINPPYNVPSSSALSNVAISNQGVDGHYAAGLYVNFANGGGSTPDPVVDTYLHNVTVTPNLPPWQDYDTTNFDGITIDGGRVNGHVYAENVTINGWDDAAIDVKPKTLQAVALHTAGSGWNTIKLWQPGPHYIVNSWINNSRWLTDNRAGASDGGLIWSWDCTTLDLRIYNSYFNGSTTLPLDRVTCEIGTPDQAHITYLTTDPTTTGEMSPMFDANNRDYQEP